MHRQRVSGEQKRKKKEEGAYQSKGAPQSEARGKARPRARRGGRHILERGEGEGTSQSNVGERGRPKVWCEKEGAASYRRRKVMGRRGTT